jgi:hypothetical protein
LRHLQATLGTGRPHRTRRWLAYTPLLPLPYSPAQPLIYPPRAPPPLSLFRCGFSRKVVEALLGEGIDFGSFDILQVRMRSGARRCAPHRAP